MKVFLTIEDSELATKTQSEMRSFINKNDIFNLGHVKAVVTDQWGDNVEHFINEIKKNHPDLWKKIKVHSG